MDAILKISFCPYIHEILCEFCAKNAYKNAELHPNDDCIRKMPSLTTQKPESSAIADTATEESVLQQ